MNKAYDAVTKLTHDDLNISLTLKLSTWIDIIDNPLETFGYRDMLLETVLFEVRKQLNVKCPTD